ncbi:MAG TPA: CHAD domain-containing protein [Thermoanaerobaculaceae bacterium]|nr:CHAD domain-containing protein [Thermoanaerobaculaceae bacterium]
MIGRVSAARIAAVLASSSPVETAAPTTVLRRHVDTFDWALWRAGSRLTLEVAAGRTTARWERAGEGRGRRLPVELNVVAAGDLPGGPLRDEVAAAAAGRALLPVGEVRARRRELRVVDADGKTRVRVWIDTIQPLRGGRPAGSRARFVTVEPLTGYARAAAAVAARLHAEPGLAATEEEELALAAAATGRRPGDYTSKLAVPLRAAEPAERAVRRILQHLAATLAANVDGTLRDLDAEFLHDLRVATRRTRTCLGQLKDVFPAAVIGRFGDEFRWLADATNQCRDLDVFVAELLRRGDALPSVDAGVLDPLLEQVRVERAEAQRELAAALTSERFGALLRRWRRVIGRRFVGGERGAEPVADLAAERTLRAYRRLSSHARRLAPGAPAAELHRLRIDAKKLRYLLEFFAGLWDPEATKALVAELKLVQDTLGDYHDAFLQVGRLKTLAPVVLASGAGAATLLAMGRLVADLERSRAVQAERVLARLSAFAAPPFPHRLAALVARRGGA